jgi:aspartyl aminopeptidase
MTIHDPGAPGRGLPTASAGRDSVPDPADDLLALVAASPTPYHAVAEMARRLEAAGSVRLDERAPWSPAPGDLCHVVREGSLAAVRIGSGSPADAGFRIVGAHTDSPTYAVRPRPDVRRAGYRLLGVEPYGGALHYTWLDRDLTVAGRVVLHDGAARLVHLPGAPLRIPSLAIHLQREVNDGLRLNPQQHLVPAWGPDLQGEPGLIAALADHVGAEPGDLLGHDLVLVDTQPPARGGAGGGWLFAPRLDNLASCAAGLAALLAAAPGEATQVLVANDHEEVGSASAEGAAGTFLADVLARLVAAADGEGGQAWWTACARSLLVSADVAHALHPNHPERHEPAHQPALGGGPVLKVNAQQRYATDAATGAWFAARCAEAGVPLQHFVTRADLPCGSTIGPITASRLGIATVDVGQPVLSMHSVREQAAAADVALMGDALAAHLSARATW